MNRKIHFALLLFAAGWLVLPGIILRGEPLNVAPREGILVLRSGGILRGAITRAGQEYYVGVGGGEIRIKADDVELSCDNLDEAYRLKAAALPTGHVTEHVALADWCLRQGLLGYAAKEIVLAREADPLFPKLKLLERRLDVAQHPVEPQVKQAPPKPAEQEKPNGSDDIVRRVPPRSVERFTSTIQPLLLNGCATAACHGTTSNNKLRLERIALGRPTSYRISQRNLASVLSCIDMENPANSSLLLFPLGPHGTANEAILTRRDMEKYRQLVDWVIDVTKNISPPAPNNVATPAAPLLQTINQRGVGASASQPKTNPTGETQATNSTAERHAEVQTQNSAPEVLNIELDSGTPTPDSSADADSSDDEQKPAARPQPSGTLKESQERQGLKFGVPVEESKAVDPFDPEVFNSQFGHRR